MDASVVGSGDGLAKPVRFLEPAGVGIGRAGAFLKGLVGPGFAWSYVGRVGWVLDVGKRVGLLASKLGLAGGLGGLEPGGLASKNLESMGRGAMGTGGMGSGAWKGARYKANGHGLGIHGAGCVQILTLLGVLAFGAQPELWALVWALVVLWVASSALADLAWASPPLRSWAPWVAEQLWLGTPGRRGRGWRSGMDHTLWRPLGYGHLPNWQCHLWERRHGPHVLDVLGPGWWVLLWH